MIEFKQWHENEGVNYKFFSECQIYFCQCDLHHKLSLFELLRIVTDAAVEDFNQRCMSYDTLTDNGIGILVSRQSFRFHKMPVGNQKVTIKTWEEKPLPLQFVRAYEICDLETGEKLVSGISTWLLVDLNSRRLMRIKDFTLREPPLWQNEHDCYPADKITAPENMELLTSRPIWFSDIDGNGHMNNARYGAFVIDSLPEEYQKKEFTDFKINYSKEAIQGQKIDLYGNFNDQEKKITIIGKQKDEICFESELYW
ncbi:MAG: acyl-[acyl-carrier-protein] thioesterase [Treponema sp.]|nr:acyl-[acyl-carrier-protein] thioesterase [Treponema sp.]